MEAIRLVKAKLCHTEGEAVMRTRKNIILCGLFIFLFLIIVFKSGTVFAETKTKLYLDISFEENLLFDKYDVDISLDGQYLDTISHGHPWTKLVDTGRGYHTVTFAKKGNSAVNGAAEVKTEGDTTLSCRIRAQKKEIKVDRLKVSADIEKSRLKMPNVQYYRLDAAESRLKKDGFINYSAESEEHASVKKKSKWIVISQDKNEGESLDKNTPIKLICREADQFMADYFVGKTFEEAEKRIHQFRYECVYIHDLTGNKKDEFLDKLKTENGAWIVKEVTDLTKDRTLKLRMKYEGMRSMPDVKDLPLDNALALLEKNDFCNVDYHSLEGEKIRIKSNWCVIRQSVPAEKDYDVDELIELTVDSKKNLKEKRKELEKRDVDKEAEQVNTEPEEKEKDNQQEDKKEPEKTTPEIPALKSAEELTEEFKGKSISELKSIFVSSHEKAVVLHRHSKQVIWSDIRDADKEECGNWAVKSISKKQKEYVVAAYYAGKDEMPNVTGMSLSDARKTLNAHEFWRIVCKDQNGENTDNPDAVVSSQSIEPGENVSCTKRIRLSVFVQREISEENDESFALLMQTLPGDAAVSDFAEAHKKEKIQFKGGVILSGNSGLAFEGTGILLRGGKYKTKEITGPRFYIRSQKDQKNLSFDVGDTVSVEGIISDNQDQIGTIVLDDVLMKDTYLPNEAIELDNSSEILAKEIQEALNDAGYSCGVPDGKPGSKTKEAISNYRSDHGLDPLTDIDQVIVSYLGVDQVKKEKPVLAKTLGNGTASEESEDQYKQEYILNRNSKKFHYPRCSSVNQMKSSNKVEFVGTRDEVIAMGYMPCGRCNP